MCVCVCVCVCVCDCVCRGENGEGMTSSPNAPSPPYADSLVSRPKITQLRVDYITTVRLSGDIIPPKLRKCGSGYETTAHEKGYSGADVGGGGGGVQGVRTPPYEE